jgi:hypothetical protein
MSKKGIDKQRIHTVGLFYWKKVESKELEN